ncbi:ent-copalyl diphosphate synthase 1-like [Rutidosis leptorrhynchoides]|uniref:ent-copalyl diphosphate synthase 1-like n=1 Tax=Rutidosis leptorrhynchoides TaxID=125765 RepID=UPI003A99FFC6
MNTPSKRDYGLVVEQHSDLPFLKEQHSFKEYIEAIRSIFSSMDDGAISISAYDTAWVALIENVDGPSGGPQFPSSLQWIANNQLPDGSWGESLLFSACDRLLNTLACVVALTTWKLHADKCQKGMKFVYENLDKIGDEKEEHFTSGFELGFTTLIELARKIDIQMPNDSPILKRIYAIRDMKLKRIPKDILYKTATILHYSLEGVKDLDWEKLLKLQEENGSFVLSAAPTTMVYMQTKDENCLAYLTSLVAKFNGGVPNVYPVDMFERSWMVDRLQRLGIAHYFHSEIMDCVAHLYRYWDERGIGAGRNTYLLDIDDTGMAFRVLRTYGHQISPDVLRQFEEDGKFKCYQWQSSESVTVMFNLYRVSQMSFPGEKILDDTRKFSQKFLLEKQSTNELWDKWCVQKDLPGEVEYALNVPWYASLPRLETRYYLEQYGGDNDVWTMKVLYRMPNVCNNIYLEMAKLDYNHCQTIHRLEWSRIQKCYAHLNIKESSNKRLLWSYYVAAASIFEQERCNERVAWAKTNIVIDIITSFFARSEVTNVVMNEFIDEFTNPQCYHKDEKPWHAVMNVLCETINQISSEASVAHGANILPHLHSVWKTWLSNLQKGVGGEAELIVQIISFSSGRWLIKEVLSHPQYRRISSVTNDICHIISTKDTTIGFTVESKMQELVQLTFCHSPDDIDPDLKKVFLMVAKTFYYKAYIDPETINNHIHKVLFERYQRASDLAVSRELINHDVVNSRVIVNKWVANRLLRLSEESGSFKFIIAEPKSTTPSYDHHKVPRSCIEASKHPHWVRAMNNEIYSLQSNDTWEVCDLPPKKKALGNHWVYKVKLKSDGTIEKFKSRLVVQGNHQRASIDEIILILFL